MAPPRSTDVRTGGPVRPSGRRAAAGWWARAVKARAEVTRRRAAAMRQRVEARRDRNKGVDVVFVAYELDRDTGGSLLAAAIAYRLFLWMLPACLVLIAGLGFASTINPDAPAHDVRDLGIVSIPAHSINQAAHQSSRAWWVALLIGILLLYVATNALVRALWATHALIWRSPGTRIVRRPRLVAVFLGAGLAIAAATSVAAIIRDAAATPGVVAMLSDFGVYAAAWWLITTQLPHGDGPHASLIPGALMFGGGIQALHLLTVYFLAQRITSASELYGTLGISAALLLGLYFMGRLMVVSAEFNEAMQTRAGGTVIASLAEQASPAEQVGAAEANAPARPGSSTSSTTAGGGSG